MEQKIVQVNLLLIYVSCDESFKKFSRYIFVILETDFNEM